MIASIFHALVAALLLSVYFLADFTGHPDWLPVVTVVVAWVNALVALAFAKEPILQALAQYLARPRVAGRLICRSIHTPYFHLPGYMSRYWLLNPYDVKTRKREYSWFPWSVRIHHILREDRDEHLHDHPWSARSFILCGWYVEEYEGDDGSRQLRKMSAGMTRTLRFGEFHRIDEVSPGGVWTLFITGPYCGHWGFKVDGRKIESAEYFKSNAARGFQ